MNHCDVSKFLLVLCCLSFHGASINLFSRCQPKNDHFLGLGGSRTVGPTVEPLEVEQPSASGTIGKAARICLKKPIALLSKELLYNTKKEPLTQLKWIELLLPVTC